MTNRKTNPSKNREITHLDWAIYIGIIMIMFKLGFSFWVILVPIGGLISEKILNHWEGYDQ